MDLDSLDDDDAAQLAARIGPHLEPGQYGDRVVLSRRQAILGLTGTLGTGALLSLGVDPAVAQAAGLQGTPEDPNDMYAYDLNVANAVTSALAMNGNAIENAGSVSTKEFDNGAIIAGNYEAGDPDSRFDSALADATNGDAIILEGSRTQYSTRTISKDVALLSPSPANRAAEIADGETWTLDARIQVDGLRLGGSNAELIFTGASQAHDVWTETGDVTISADQVILSQISGAGSVTFESGTSDGDIAAVEGRVTVTDNGTNL